MNFTLNDWKHCKKCKLGRWAYSHVFGRGLWPADIMFVGEAPGKSEDILGEPFIGPAGRLFSEAIQEAEPGRLRLFFTNLVACRPCDEKDGPNRQPSHLEIENCRPRLVETFEQVKPKQVILVGNVAGTNYKAAYSACIVHPAYILRNGGKQSKLWEEFVNSIKAVFKKAKNE